MTQPLDMAAHGDDAPAIPRSCRDCAHASSNRKYDPFRECNVRDFICFAERGKANGGCGPDAKWFQAALPKPKFLSGPPVVALVAGFLLGIAVMLVVR